MIVKRTAFAALAALMTSLPAHAAVTISTAATQNMSCSKGVCSPTAMDAVLFAGDLRNLLTTGNVTVTTTGPGVQANSIDVEVRFELFSGTTLTLDAHKAIAFHRRVFFASGGGLSIVTSGRGGSLSFGRFGHVAFRNLSSPLTINGSTYTLVNSIATLASAIAGNPSGNYALASNYDASKDGTYINSPVGATLTGIVEGLGNTVSHLAVTTNKGLNPVGGLFAEIGTSGIVESLNLSAVSVDQKAVQHGITGTTGGFVGANYGTMYDDHANGTVRAVNAYLGGLVGGNAGTINASSAAVQTVVTGGRQGIAGGLAGSSVRGTISNSHATGDVVAKGRSTNSLLGGLVGYSVYDAIDQNYATGKVSGLAGSSDGGLIGAASSSITNSYATGTVSGGSGSLVGGLLGSTNDCAVGDSYSTGKVSGGYVGGFSEGPCMYGNSDGFTDCYWDTTTSGTDDGVYGTNVSGLVGLSTKQFQSGLPAGFDPAIWAENPNINNGLPYLINNPPPK